MGDPGNEQRLLGVLISADFGPPDNFDPIGTGASSIFSPTERITVVRSIGQIDLWCPVQFGEDISPLRAPMRLVAALMRLDEGGVWQAGYVYPSAFFDAGFWRDERVLQTWQPEPGIRPLFAGTGASLGFNAQMHKARIEWDLKVPMRFETGESLWLVMEGGPCVDDETFNYDLAWNYWGYSRTLWRE